MKNFFLSIFLLLITSSLFAARDSLLRIELKALETFKITDVQSLKNYRKLVIPPTKFPFTVKKYLLKGLKQAHQFQNDSLQISFAYFLGVDAYYHLGVVDSIIYYANKTLGIATQNPNQKKWQAYALHLRMQAEMQKEDFVSSFQTGNQIIEIYQKMGDFSDVIYPYQYLGNLYFDVGDTDKAIASAHKSLDIAYKKPFPDSTYSVVYANERLATYFAEKKDIDSTNFYIKRTLEEVARIDTIQRNFMYPAISFTAYIRAAYHYLELQQTDLANTYRNKAAKYVQDIARNKFRLSCFDFAYAVETNNLIKATQIIEDSLFSTTKGAYNLEKNRMQNKINYYRAKNQPEKALQIAIELNEYETSQHRLESNRFIVLASSQAAIKDKENQIKLLNQEQNYQQDLKERLMWLVALITALFLVSLYAYRQTKNKNRLLRKDLERKQVIAEQTEKLKKLDRLKSKFFQNISHELGTPLALITAPIKSALQRGLMTQTDRKLIKIAEQNADNLLKLSNQILDISKSEIGELKVNLEEADLVDFLTNISRSFQELAASQNINFILTPKKSVPIIICSDFFKLEAIITNLLSNALKFSAPKGIVELKYEVHPEQLFFTISDNGMGIPKEDLPYIFDLYYQAEVPKHSVGVGSGIGLSICQEYTRLLNGTLQVESIEGRGTTFTLMLPKIVDSSMGKAQNDFITTFDSAYPSLHPERDTYADHLLIVEDNLQMCAYLSSILEKDFALTIVNNGQQALDFLVHTLPTLIITDIMMPVMDGLELIKKLKEHAEWKKIPVLALSAKKTPEDKELAIRVGVDDYLGKPFEEVTLKAHLSFLLENAIQRQEIESPNQLKKEDQIWLDQLQTEVLEAIGHFDLNLNYIARKMEVSVAYLHLKIKPLTGMTPKQFIRELRFQEARKLLVNKKISSVKALSYTVGFKSEKNFSRNFKKRFGKYPSEYLKD